MRFVELTEDEISYLKHLILVDTNDGKKHPDEEKLYEKLDNA